MTGHLTRDEAKAAMILSLGDPKTSVFSLFKWGIGLNNLYKCLKVLDFFVSVVPNS